MSDEMLEGLIDGLELTRLGERDDAGLAVVSLPLPRGASQAWSLSGKATHVKPVGRWPGTPSPGPRRLILGGDIDGAAPDALRVSRDIGAPAASPPTAELEVFEHGDIDGLGEFYFERCALNINWGGRTLSLVMGMRVGEELHWWEHCKLVVLDQSESCLEIEVGGSIAWELLTLESLRACENRALHPHIHKHNWLSANVYARLHANGVCEFYAHHINSMFVDDGGDLVDAVPVIALRSNDAQAAADQAGGWDGSRDRLTVDGVAFDMTDVARLATPDKPGNVAMEGDFVVLQPYLAMEWHGGPFTEGRIGDPWYMKAQDRKIPRGFARTLRFSASLNPDRSPRVARYLAPAWWYGMCEEFQPRPLLPVSNALDVTIDSTRKWLHKYMIPAGFEEGVLPNQHSGDPSERTTPGAEGDKTGALFQMAYRSRDPRDYACALRGSFAFLDVFVDHATKRVRMQGYPPPTCALPLMRMQSGIFAWLETGDPYCRLTVEHVLDTAYAWHKNVWPRPAVGRDSRFVHSLVLMYRYANDTRSLERARDVIHDIGVAQWEDGSFGDQGGGAGIHGAGAYLAKPWMGWLATFAVLDYLEVVPDDEEAQAIVTRFADWMMAERAPRNAGEDRKVMGWTYQHFFKGKTLADHDQARKPAAETHLFHFEYVARLLPWMTIQTGDNRYFEAWSESYEGRGLERSGSYWEGISIMLFLPWLQDRLWNATLSDIGEVVMTPANFGPRTPGTATIHTPAGPVEVAWRDGKVELPDSASGVEVRC